MKCILIDAGNSRLKLSIIDLSTCLELYFSIFDYHNLYDNLSSQLADFSIQNVIISNVNSPIISHIISDVSLYLWGIKTHIVITEQNKYGITTLYSNPKLLGSDRWLALIAARTQTVKSVCVIDCGSAVTIDILNDENLHLGGFITPGLSLSRKTMGQNTSKLPFMVEHNFSGTNSSAYYATNTHDAISAGTLYQLSAYIEHIIAEIKNDVCDNIECIITGGDAIIAQKLISHHLIYREKLVLDGLKVVAKDLYTKDFL